MNVLFAGNSTILLGESDASAWAIARRIAAVSSVIPSPTAPKLVISRSKLPSTTLNHKRQQCVRTLVAPCGAMTMEKAPHPKPNKIQ
eukprot:scaffold3170_cov128-Cylindrotheca_fusiformis.AAC.8